MRAIEVTLKWLSPEAIRLEDLPAFWDKTDEKCGTMGDKSGIYFWIHNGKRKRIAYIGEAGSFKKRFATHLKLALHGQYSAADCGDGDLFDFYDCHTKYSTCKKAQCPKKYDKCMYYKPIQIDENNNFSNVYAHHDTVTDDICRGIHINNAYTKKLTFLFAEIIGNNSKHQAELRREVEGLLMLQMLHSRTDEAAPKDGAKRRGQHFCTRKRSFFWGFVNKYPQQECEYTINSHLPPALAGVLKEELGWEAPKWTFSVNEIKRLLNQPR